MADQVGECNVNNTLLAENAFNVNDIKEEVCQDDDFADDKVSAWEAPTFVDNAELQDDSLPNKMKQCDASTASDNIKTELLPSKLDYNVTHNLKIEEGISPNDTKIEHKELLYCEDCQVYYVDFCAKCEMLVHILNKTVPVNADDGLHEELPHQNILEIQDDRGQFHVYALKVIPVGVRFGPFTGLNAIERPWKIKGGKFVIDKNKSKYLNWMQYINPARSISEQNLRVVQYEHNLYYESTRQIQAGDELLVHFGEEYEDRNVEMDFVPTTKHILKDAFACTFCCLGYSSKSYLAKHKTICTGNVTTGFSIEELTQCPTCTIHLDQTEYIMHHMAYCGARNDRKYILPTPGDRRAHANWRKTRSLQFYKCQQCKYRTKHKGNLKNHVSHHYEVKTYKCGICCRRFKTKEILKLHEENTGVCAGEKEDWVNSFETYMNPYVKVEHSCSQGETKRFMCSRCEFRTKYKISLKRHTKAKHLGEFKYRCDRCDYKTNFQTCLKTHTETIHMQEFKYKCDTCDYETNWKADLKTHVEARHLKEFKYKCDTCGFITNFKSCLHRHIKTRHLKEFQYKCDSCDYKANLKANLTAHIEARHSKDFKYKCVTCDYETSQKCQLKAHIETKHLEEFKHKCDSCDYKSNRKSNLKGHIKAKHLKEFNYACDACGYKTNWKSKLKVHIETKHLKEFKYKCDGCDYKTNFQTNLKTHIETIHLKEAKYKCDMCDYKTNNKSNLKTHTETIHLKEFKYKCDTCDYKSNRKAYLQTHIETTHLKEFKHKCDTCDYRTNFKSSLKRHIKTRHYT